MKYEDGTECSETSAYKIKTPGNYSEESIRHSEHGESLKSRMLHHHHHHHHHIFHAVGPLVHPYRSHVSRRLFKGLPRFLLPVGEQYFIMMLYKTYKI